MPPPPGGTGLRDIWSAINASVQAINGLTQTLAGSILAGPQGGSGGTGAPGSPGVIPRSYLAGLTLSNDVGSPNTVLDIAAGQATDSTNAVGINLGTFTKSISGAWAAGTGQNGMGQGLTATASSWYNVILANNGGTPDIYFDTSLTGANRPSGITDPLIRRIGTIVLDGSVHIIPFAQLGDEFLWKTAINNINMSTLGTTSFLCTLSVPPGLQLIARIRAQMTNAITDAAVLITSPDELDQPVNTPVGMRTGQNRGASLTSGTQATIDVRTNTSSQIRAVADNANTALTIVTYGWIDRRGRDA